MCADMSWAVVAVMCPHRLRERRPGAAGGAVAGATAHRACRADNRTRRRNVLIFPTIGHLRCRNRARRQAA